MGTLSFSVTPGNHDTFADDPPHAQEFYLALGKLIVVWSKVERAIDIVAAQARSIDSRNSISEKPNVGLKRKIKAIRRALQGHDAFEGGQRAADRLLSTVGRFAQTRNLIIHGLSSGLNETQPPTIKFNSATYLPDRTDRKSGEFSLHQLNEIIAQMQQIDRYLAILVLTVGSAATRSQRVQRQP